MIDILDFYFITDGSVFSKLVHPQKLVHDLLDLLKTHQPKEQSPK